MVGIFRFHGELFRYYSQRQRPQSSNLSTCLTSRNISTFDIIFYILNDRVGRYKCVLWQQARQFQMTAVTPAHTYDIWLSPYSFHLCNRLRPKLCRFRGFTAGWCNKVLLKITSGRIFIALWPFRGHKYCFWIWKFGRILCTKILYFNKALLDKKSTSRKVSSIQAHLENAYVYAENLSQKLVKVLDGTSKKMSRSLRGFRKFLGVHQHRTCQMKQREHHWESEYRHLNKWFSKFQNGLNAAFKKKETTADADKDV